MPILILKTGRTLEPLRDRRGDFEDWIIAGMGVEPAAFTVANVYEDGALPSLDALDGLAGVVVTGSAAMVSEREPWSERGAGWLAQAVASDVPTLGICYGHQLLAHALGGRVGPNPLGREIGTHPLGLEDSARDDPLLGMFGDSTRLHFSHVESVLELPGDAQRLASTARDPNAAFRVGPSAWGVQFHPEFDAETMRTYLRERRVELADEGIDAGEHTRQVRECPNGPALLRRFAALTSDRDDTIRATSEGDFDG